MAALTFCTYANLGMNFLRISKNYIDLFAKTQICLGKNVKAQLKLSLFNFNSSETVF